MEKFCLVGGIKIRIFSNRYKGTETNAVTCREAFAEKIKECTYIQYEPIYVHEQNNHNDI